MQLARQFFRRGYYLDLKIEVGVLECEETEFDIGWIVLDHAKATRLWDWRPATPTAAILGEIAAHAEANPGWLELSAPV